jgi:hypothetical protein
MKDLIDFLEIYKRISCSLIGEESYANCSNKEPKEIEQKIQSFNEAGEKIIEISPSKNTKLFLKKLLFEDLFNSK